MPDGNSIRYQGSMYVSTWNEWVLGTKLGGTAEANSAFVPVVLLEQKLFLYLSIICSVLANNSI